MHKVRCVAFRCGESRLVSVRMGMADEARHVAVSHVMARYGTEQSGRLGGVSPGVLGWGWLGFG